jgi:hypothetical protein
MSSTLSRARAHAVSYHSGPSSHNSPFSGEFNIAEDGFLDSEHRAGGPYLCSLPSTSKRVKKDYDRQYHFLANSQKISEATKSVLDKRGMAYLNISVEGRRSRFDPESHAIPTVIVVLQTIPSQTRDAAREIHHSLQAEFPEICVDIMDDIITRPFLRFPVSRSEKIIKKRNEISEEIFLTLDLTEVISVDCKRYCTSETPTENTITVIVNIRKESTSEWTTATRQVREILDQFGVSDVDILFHKDEVWSWAGDNLLHFDACRGPVILGYPSVSNQA